MRIEITTDELQREFEGVRSCQPVSMDIVTEPKMNKTGNPYFGSVVKEVTVHGLVGFIYKNVVNNQLGREDKELDFAPQPRKWGERHGTLVHHKGKVYVEIKAQGSSEPIYRNLQGLVMDVALLKPYMPERKAPKTQDNLEKKVILRDINLDNILAVRMLGNEYVVNNEVTEIERERVSEAAQVPAEIEQQN